MAPAANPRDCSSSATLAAVRLVRANTMLRPRPSDWSSRASTSTLSSAWARYTTCLMFLTVAPSSSGSAARMCVGCFM